MNREAIIIVSTVWYNIHTLSVQEFIKTLWQAQIGFWVIPFPLKGLFDDMYTETTYDKLRSILWHSLSLSLTPHQAQPPAIPGTNYWHQLRKRKSKTFLHIFLEGFFHDMNKKTIYDKLRSNTPTTTTTNMQVTKILLKINKKPSSSCPPPLTTTTSFSSIVGLLKCNNDVVRLCIWEQVRCGVLYKGCTAFLGES